MVTPLRPIPHWLDAQFRDSWSDLAPVGVRTGGQTGGGCVR
jgi:hypothetical protein